jgi:hypothetical protein
VNKKARSTFLVLATMALLIGACNNGQKSQDSASPAKAQAVPVISPVISSENAEYDWGKVEEGEIVEHIFKVQNKGEGLLEIKKATSS